jgi:uncharacterized protein
MHFNVSEIVRERSGFAHAYRVDESVVFTDDEKIQVIGSVRFVRTDNGVWVTAKLQSQVDTECGRCLDEYGHLVDVTIDEEAVPESDSVNSVRLVEDYGVEEQLVIDEDHVLDLSESTRQYIALGLPMQPLCRPDCKGLCSTCGVNRNREACTCDQIQRDNRWGALLDLVSANETFEISKN